MACATLVIEVWLGTVLRCRAIWTLWVGSVALMEEVQTRPEGVEDWFQALPNLFLGHVRERSCEFISFTQCTYLLWTVWCAQAYLYIVIYNYIFFKDPVEKRYRSTALYMEMLHPWNHITCPRWSPEGWEVALARPLAKLSHCSCPWGGHLIRFECKDVPRLIWVESLLKKI